MSQLNTLLAVEINNYSPGTRDYAVLGPVKAIERLARGEGWVAEKVVIRHLANGNDEHLHVLSRPKPPPPPASLPRESSNKTLTSGPSTGGLSKNPPVPPPPLKEPPSSASPPKAAQPAPSRVSAATARVKEAIRGDHKP